MQKEAEKKRKRIRKSKEKEGQQDPLMQCGTPWYKILGSFFLWQKEGIFQSDLRELGNNFRKYLRNL